MTVRDGEIGAALHDDGTVARRLGREVVPAPKVNPVGTARSAQPVSLATSSTWHAGLVSAPVIKDPAVCHFHPPAERPIRPWRQVWRDHGAV